MEGSGEEGERGNEGESRVGREGIGHGFGLAEMEKMEAWE